MKKKIQSLFGYFIKRTSCNPSGKKREQKMQLAEKKQIKERWFSLCHLQKRKKETTRSISRNKNAY